MDEATVVSGVNAQSRPLEDQLTAVLRAAREMAGVDHLQLWALSPDGSQLAYFAQEGLSQAHAQALEGLGRVAMDEAGPIAKACVGQTSILIDETQCALLGLR